MFKIYDPEDQQEGQGEAPASETDTSGQEETWRINAPPGIRRNMRLPDSKRKAPPRRKKFTLVARGKDNKGLRFMLDAKDTREALVRSGQICVREKLELVAVFSGHMRAMKYVRFDPIG